LSPQPAGDNGAFHHEGGESVNVLYIVLIVLLVLILLGFFTRGRW
jgi:hypothetical protein